MQINSYGIQPVCGSACHLNDPKTTAQRTWVFRTVHSEDLPSGVLSRLITDASKVYFLKHVTYVLLFGKSTMITFNHCHVTLHALQIRTLEVPSFCRENEVGTNFLIHDIKDCLHVDSMDWTHRTEYFLNSFVMWVSVHSRMLFSLVVCNVYVSK